MVTFEREGGDLVFRIAIPEETVKANLAPELHIHTAESLDKATATLAAHIAVKTLGAWLNEVNLDRSAKIRELEARIAELEQPSSVNLPKMREVFPNFKGADVREAEERAASEARAAEIAEAESKANPERK